MLKKYFRKADSVLIISACLARFLLLTFVLFIAGACTPMDNYTDLDDNLSSPKPFSLPSITPFDINNLSPEQIEQLQENIKHNNSNSSDYDTSEEEVEYDTFLYNSSEDAEAWADLIVYISDDSDEYHRYGCEYFGDADYEAVDLDWAEENQYEPCFECFP